MITTLDSFLGGKVQIEQPLKGYRAGVDPVLLAAACPAKPGDTVLDIGCGVGTAAFCLAYRVSVHITGVELLAGQAKLAQQNSVRNKTPFIVVTGDATKRPTVLSDQSFDHVITNPPYFEPKSGPVSDEATRANGRSGAIDLDLWIGTAFKRLKPKGWLTLVQRMERLPDVLGALGGFGDIQVLPISARQGRKPPLFLLRARKGAKTPFQMLSPLVMHSGMAHDGDKESYVPVVQDVLRSGAALPWG